MELAQGNALERIQQVGIRGVTALELLTVVLSRTEGDVELNQTGVAQRFRHHTVARFADLSFEEMHDAAGIERFEATRFLSAIELGRRAGVASQGGKGAPITRHEQAFELFKHMADLQQEHFCAAFFDSKANLISQKVIHIGTLNSSVVGAREVFREAVRNNAASVIVAHNHPSGDPDPSPEDIKVTRSLKQAGELLDIALLDHIVVGHNGDFVSLNDRGVL